MDFAVITVSDDTLQVRYRKAVYFLISVEQCVNNRVKFFNRAL